MILPLGKVRQLVSEQAILLHAGVKNTTFDTCVGCGCTLQPYAAHASLEDLKYEVTFYLCGTCNADVSP